MFTIDRDNLGYWCWDSRTNKYLQRDKEWNVNCGEIGRFNTFRYLLSILTQIEGRKLLRTNKPKDYMGRIRPTTRWYR